MIDTNRKRLLVGAVCYLGMIGFFLLTRGGFYSNFLAYICLFIIAGHGWNLLGGYVGEISFGHAAFFGIGAYSVGLPIAYGFTGVPLLVLVVLGGFMAGFFALLLSGPLLRVKGFPFLVGTYGIGFVMQSVVVNTQALYATRGIFIPPFSQTALYLIIFGVTVGTTLFVAWLVEQNVGLRFRAVRDVPTAAQMIGISIFRTKAVALILGAFICGIAGGLFALYGSFVQPSSAFGFGTSISILLGPYIGGVGTVLGPVLGTWIVITLQEYARSSITITGGHHFALGALLVFVMMVNREGVYPGVRKLVRRLARKWARKRTAA